MALGPGCAWESHMGLFPQPVPMVCGRVRALLGCLPGIYYVTKIHV